jgi:Domain of unknown function (DUF4268)
MRPVPGANGEAVNWINYRTGIKGIYFRMDAGKNTARIGIELDLRDDELKERYYKQLELVRNLLEDETGEQWEWEKHLQDEQRRPISRISKTLEGINIFNKADWPGIISFFKPRIMAMDRFWEEVRDGFE